MAFKIKTESVKAKQKEKTRKQLQEENEALAAQVTGPADGPCATFTNLPPP